MNRHKMKGKEATDPIKELDDKTIGGDLLLSLNIAISIMIIIILYIKSKREGQILKGLMILKIMFLTHDDVEYADHGDNTEKERK